MKPIVLFLRRLVRRLKRFICFAKNGFRPNLKTLQSVEYFGTEYGGWPLVTSLIDSESVVLSFGLGQDISFDLAVIDKFGSTVHGFDPTPKSAKWIQDQDLPAQFKYHSVGLAGKNGTITFFAPSNPNFASWSATSDAGNRSAKVELPVKSIDFLIRELDLKIIDVLKMDIEGSENEVIDSLKDSEIRPSQILVEFHHRIHNTDFAKTKSAIETLESLGYRLFHISDLGDEYSLVLEKALG